MDIQATKLELLKVILENDNTEFIQKIADFVRQEKKDFWNDLSPEQQKEIEEGLDQLNKGKRVSMKSVLDKVS